MNKNAIIGVLLIVVLVLLGFLISGSKETQAPTGDGQEQVETTQEESSPAQSQPSVTTKPKVQTSTPTPAPAVAEEPVVVVYTGDRFTPSIAVISRGQKVIFLNQSDQKMWVMSDGSLPALNEGVAVIRGGTYSYVFNNTGKYTYLNKENPTRGGTIVVNYD